MLLRKNTFQFAVYLWIRTQSEIGYHFELFTLANKRYYHDHNAHHKETIFSTSQSTSSHGSFSLLLLLHNRQWYILPWPRDNLSWNTKPSRLRTREWISKAIPAETERKLAVVQKDTKWLFFKASQKVFTMSSNKNRTINPLDHLHRPYWKYW